MEDRGSRAFRSTDGKRSSILQMPALFNGDDLRHGTIQSPLQIPSKQIPSHHILCRRPLLVAFFYAGRRSRPSALRSKVPQEIQFDNVLYVNASDALLHPWIILSSSIRTVSKVQSMRSFSSPPAPASLSSIAMASCLSLLQPMASKKMGSSIILTRTKAWSLVRSWTSYPDVLHLYQA